jgi:hypothetical protein
MERSRLDGVARLQLNFKMIWKSHGLGTAPGIEVSVATNTPTSSSLASTHETEFTMKTTARGPAVRKGF